MIVFASGEGVTDIGNGDSIGLMAKLIDFRIKKYNTEYEFEIIPKKELKNNKTLKLPSKKDSVSNIERRYFFKNTYCLSKIIKNKLKDRETDLLLVVFFRDSDTIEQKEWEDKYNSIVSGFKAGQCERGIPMLPKTSSEVWLLSSILDSHKMDGRILEKIRDRDSLKRILKEKIGNDNIYDYQFDFSKISAHISSYKIFELDCENILSRN
jgi:hypothetical protein